MRFVHVATRTKDLERALAFYEALGLRKSRTKQLTKGRATLVFVEPPEGNFAIELVYNWGRTRPTRAASASATSPSKATASMTCCLH